MPLPTQNSFEFPKGTGISKRLLITIVGLFFVIIILFLIFMHASSKNINKEKTQDTVTEKRPENVDTMIGRIERHKYQKTLLPEQDIKQKSSIVFDSTPASDLLKEAGNAPLDVYHENSQNNPEPNVENNNVNRASDFSNILGDQKPSQYDQANNQSKKIAFLKQSKVSQDQIDETLKNPVSKYEINAGTIIPATLVTGIDSDLPGNIIAKVSEDVFDTVTGNYLLIPQGTTLIGVYDSQVSLGQSRVLIVWSRLIFPNGSSFDLDGMPGADLTGASGLHDQVDNHYFRIFGSALLMSAFGAAGQLSQPQTNTGYLTPQQTIYTAIGQEMSQASVQLIAKNMDIQPTIRIRPGDNFNVLLTRDMVFPGHYIF